MPVKRDNILVYMAGPYSRYPDKEKLMDAFMTTAGKWMLEHPGNHVVSPLYMHYSLKHVPGMSGDYNFFGDYSRNLLRRCDLVVVVMFPGWEESTGVRDEIATAEKCGIPVEYIDAPEI
jgi:hypothetical protein